MRVPAELEVGREGAAVLPPPTVVAPQVGLERVRRRGRIRAALPLLGPAFFPAIAHRPAHLPGKLGGDVVVHRQKRVEKGEHVAAALGDRRCPPLGQRRARGRERGLDRGILRNRALGVNRAVNGGDDLHAVRHFFL